MPAGHIPGMTFPGILFFKDSCSDDRTAVFAGQLYRQRLGPVYQDDFRRVWSTTGQLYL